MEGDSFRLREMARLALSLGHTHAKRRCKALLTADYGIPCSCPVFQPPGTP